MTSPAFYPLGAILIVLDFLIYLLTFGWVKKVANAFEPEPLRSVPVENDESYRHAPACAKKGLSVTPFEGVSTIYELTKRSVSVHGSDKCMGSRTFLGQLSPKVKKFGDIKYRTYTQAGGEINKFGAALSANGFVASPTTTNLKQITTPSAFAIYENTSAEWMIACQGCFTQSVTVVTIYATLGVDAVIDAVKDCNLRGILCNKINVKTIVDRIGEMPSLKVIVYTNDLVAPDSDIAVPKAPAGVSVVSFEDFVASGDVQANPPTPPAPESCAVVMYTSGSTGKPKGVVVTHGNLLATVAGASVSLGFIVGKEVYLGYLPLAHILEMMAEFGLIGFGGMIGYADPKTLTQTGSSPIGALEAFSPTVMAGVPKIWDVIKKGVQAKIALAPPLNQFLFNTAFMMRSFAISHGYDTPLFAAIVFKKFSKVVGGKLRLALSGGGPLNTEVQIFARTCFGCPLVQGYGLTETCAGLTMQDPLDLRTGMAGAPIECCAVKLLSCDVTDKAKLPYLTSDRRDTEGNAIFGRGEVLVRGNNISKGYYMMEEKTKEEYDSDGFFHTGDVGQFMADGSIRIVDRIKNLVKLKGGEYIAIENMEMTYGNSNFVDAVAGGVCCYGDGEMDRPVLLMQLNKLVSIAWAKSQGLDDLAADYDALVKSEQLYKAVLADMHNEQVKAKLSSLEKVVAITFLTEPWTPENGCLTAANKLQRKNVIETHEKEWLAVMKKGIFD